eukprot:5082322-Prymnesium_polylepis.1
MRALVSRPLRGGIRWWQTRNRRLAGRQRSRRPRRAACCSARRTLLVRSAIAAFDDLACTADRR